ncbi:hypothetical protein PISL3812_09581 [Talaromyces islandicus]|uniref:EthD domain-containing protein n=1 Tax=Talaromyces islandicus TaxID=28573 RepID=A0A0U1MBZ5_TALIS|nr:hypothetical protein PISL3812_09581 [Talaromyces islandicus]
MAPLTSIPLPLSTSKSEQDYIDLIKALTYNILDSSYTDEPSAVATRPPSESLRYCSHFSDCPYISGDPNAAPSDIGTIVGPDYPPGYNFQELLHDAETIAKEVAITTHTSTTSEPTVVTVTESSSRPPYTQTRSDWNVVVCDKYTVIDGRNFDYHSTSCLGSSSTITSLKPQVTLRMDATPCNWGTMASTDIYTSISSALMDACSASPVPTKIEMVPDNPGGVVWGPQAFNTTMSACNPKTMTISNVDGPLDQEHGRWNRETGEVLFTADKNFFDPAHLPALVNASAHFVAKSARSNGLKMSFREEAEDWSGVEVSNYYMMMYSTNSTELNWYDPGYTQYTQAFLVDYTWRETFPASNLICEYVNKLAQEFSEEIPELVAFVTPAAVNKALKNDISKIQPSWEFADFDLFIEYTMPSMQTIRDIMADPDWHEAIKDQDDWVDTTRALLSIGHSTPYIVHGEVVNMPE